VARTNLDAARDHGSAPVEALAQAETAALQAHADENLTLIDRDYFTADSFQADFLAQQRRLGPGPGTLLTEAAATAQGSRGGPQAAAALRDAPAWFAAHQEVKSLNDSGYYTAAVGNALGVAPADSGYRFARLDADLTGAIAADQASFRSAAQQGRDDLAFLEAGMIVMSLVMATGCAWGISRRLAEYR
jgi:hypothetical protein